MALVLVETAVGPHRGVISMPVQCTCSSCGKSFARMPSLVGRRNYCSHECCYAARRSGRAGATLSADGATALIPLHARDGSVRAHAIVDAADAEWAAQWPWSLTGQDGYAHRRDKASRQTIKLHRALLGLTPGDGMEGDHINRDRLDCRRSNLRAVPKVGRGNAQNKSNYAGSKSSFRGVSFDARSGKWRARVQVDGKSTALGFFNSETEAGEAARLGRERLMPYAVD